MSSSKRSSQKISQLSTYIGQHRPHNSSKYILHCCGCRPQWRSRCFDQGEPGQHVGQRYGCYSFCKSGHQNTSCRTDIQAPNNSALQAIGSAVGNLSMMDLRSILEYHGKVSESSYTKFADDEL